MRESWRFFDSPPDTLDFSAAARHAAIVTDHDTVSAAPGAWVKS